MVSFSTNYERDDDGVVNYVSVLTRIELCVMNVLSFIIIIFVFQEVQERIKTHLLATDLSYFKYDDFIYVLDLVNRYLQQIFSYNTVALE